MGGLFSKKQAHDRILPCGRPRLDAISHPAPEALFDVGALLGRKSFVDTLEEDSECDRDGFMPSRFLANELHRNPVSQVRSADKS